MASKLKLTELLYPTSTTPAITINADDTVTFGAPTTTITNLSATNLAYTGTLTGGTGVVNIGSGQVYKDASGNVGIGTVTPYFFVGAKTLQLTATDYSVVQQSVTASTANNGNWRQIVRGSIGSHVYQMQLMNDANSAEQTIYEVSRTANSVDYQRWYGGTNEAMRITSSGNVGIGTSSPSGKLDIVTSTTATVINSNNATNTGFVLKYASNLTSLGNNFGQPLAFLTNDTERMRIDASGNLMVGTTTQNGKLSIAAGTSTAIYASNTGSTWTQLFVHGNATNQFYTVFCYPDAATPIGSITGNNTSTAYNTTSDYRLKENVAPMTGALATVAALKPCTYTWKADGSAGQGFIAHELQSVVPDCVTGEKDAVDAEGKPQYQGVDTSFLVATLVSAIQELKAEIDLLKGN